MASCKAKSFIFRSSLGASVVAIRSAIEQDLGARIFKVVREPQSGQFLVEVNTKEQAEQLFSDGFALNHLHVQPSPPSGTFTNVSIMSLRAYIDDTEIIRELEKYGDIKSEVIRLKYKTGRNRERELSSPHGFKQTEYPLCTQD